MIITVLIGLVVACVVLVYCLRRGSLRRASRRPFGPWQKVSYMQRHRSDHEQVIVNQVGDGIIRR